MLLGTRALADQLKRPRAACLLVLRLRGTELPTASPESNLTPGHRNQDSAHQGLEGNSASAFTKQRATAPYIEYKSSVDSDI